MYCSKCGGTIPANVPFCSNCGTPVQNVPQPSSPFPAPGGPWQPPTTDGKATASLVLGILSVTCFSILAGIPAIILGHSARSNIRKSGGRLTGDGMALGGLLMGYISIAFVPILFAIAIPNLMRSKMAANQAAAAANVRTLVAAETTYSYTYEKAGYAPDLTTLGPGGSACSSPTEKNACLIDATLGCSSGTSGQWCVKDEYKFSISGVSDKGAVKDFVITATPAATSYGQRTFCATSDGVVRWRAGPPLSDSIKTPGECGSWEAL